MAEKRLWSRHVRNLTQAIEAYETFAQQVNAPGFDDLEFMIPDVEIRYEGDDTKMRLTCEDDAVWVVLSD